MYNISDAAISKLFKFCNIIFAIASTLCGIPQLQEISNAIPCTLYAAKRLIGLEKDKFTKYIVCPMCDKLYTQEQACVETSRGRKKSAKCTYVQYPRHPQRAQRTACGTLLMKSVRGKNGSEHLVAKRTYCYNSLITALQAMALQANFKERCSHWKKVQSTDNILRDIYDGQIWKTFTDSNGTSFWDNPCNLGFSLNIDWFQPYKYSVYSVGAMYLVLQNLPREERFKEENIILIGILPGPGEPHKHMNSYLAPLVDELKMLWSGVELSDKSPEGKSVYRGALICISCDIPASRKCAGFLSHVAKQGIFYTM